MKFLVWEDRFESGINAFDEQHRQEFDSINKVYRSVIGDDPHEEIARCMEELLKGVEAHFQYEQKLMEQQGYDDLKDHREEHYKLLVKLREHRDKYLATHESATAYELLEYVHSWFIRHIDIRDRQLWEFMSSRSTE